MNLVWIKIHLVYESCVPDISILINIILYQIITKHYLSVLSNFFSFVFKFNLVYLICNNTICKLPDLDYTAYVCISQTNHLHLVLFRYRLKQFSFCKRFMYKLFALVPASHTRTIIPSISERAIYDSKLHKSVFQD